MMDVYNFIVDWFLTHVLEFLVFSFFLTICAALFFRNKENSVNKDDGFLYKKDTSSNEKRNEGFENDLSFKQKLADIGYKKENNTLDNSSKDGENEEKGKISFKVVDSYEEDPELVKRSSTYSRSLDPARFAEVAKIMKNIESPITSTTLNGEESDDLQQKNKDSKSISAANQAMNKEVNNSSLENKAAFNNDVKNKKSVLDVRLKQGIDSENLSACMDSKTRFNKSSFASDPDLETLVLFIKPKNEKNFIGYELLQSLADNYVHFSEKKHFQRFTKINGQGEVWFHVASLSHPGTFDMQEPGKIRCPGLVLILNVAKVKQLMRAFETMMETSRQLSEDLSGVVFDDKMRPLNQEKISKWRQDIARIAAQVYADAQ